MRIPDLFDLLRIPNVATAVSDIVAASAIGLALGSEASTTRLVCTGAASACFYLGGMALNDVADAESDARLRPTRPIPSGRVSRGEATGITVVLLGLGLALAWWAGWSVFLVSLGLLAAILLYDLALAGRILVGPLGMAACRGLNLAMGLAAAGVWGIEGVLATGLLMLYVFGLTHLSLGEVEGSARRAVGLTGLTTLATALGIVLLARVVGMEDRWDTWLVFLLVLAVFLVRAFGALGRAFRGPIPSRVGPAVGMLVTCILWLDASIAVAVGGPRWLVLLLPLSLVQEWLRRSYRVT